MTKLHMSVDVAPNTMVSMTKDAYDEMQEDLQVLYALQAAGVDSWDGYDFAMESIED